MQILTLILIISIVATIVLLWREHTRAYYELEEQVEKRLGPVREQYDGVGDFAYTSSGLIPRLNKIYNLYGDRLVEDEIALMRRSRACYYVGGSLMLLTFLTVLFLMRYW